MLCHCQPLIITILLLYFCAFELVIRWDHCTVKNQISDIMQCLHCLCQYCTSGERHHHTYIQHFTAIKQLTGSHLDWNINHHGLFLLPPVS